MEIPNTFLLVSSLFRMMTPTESEIIPEATYA